MNFLKVLLIYTWLTRVCITLTFVVICMDRMPVWCVKLLFSVKKADTVIAHKLFSITNNTILFPAIYRIIADWSFVQYFSKTIGDNKKLNVFHIMWKCLELEEIVALMPAYYYSIVHCFLAFINLIVTETAREPILLL